MEIRHLTPAEIPQGLELVRDVFLEFEAPDYPPEGVEEFFRFLDDPQQGVPLLLRRLGRNGSPGRSGSEGGAHLPSVCKAGIPSPGDSPCSDRSLLPGADRGSHSQFLALCGGGLSPSGIPGYSAPADSQWNHFYAHDPGSVTPLTEKQTGFVLK